MVEELKCKGVPVSETPKGIARQRTLVLSPPQWKYLLAGYPATASMIAVQKSLKMKPRDAGIWEHVGVEKKRPRAHTQPHSGRAFSVEVGAACLQSSSHIGK